MDTFWQDLRFAARTLRKNLSVTLLAVGSLALAIAGNTTVYSMMNSFLFRPMPYAGVERLVLVGENNSGLLRGQISTTSASNFLDVKARQSSFQQMEAFRTGAFNLRGGEGSAELLSSGLVTPGFFSMLGVRMELGRGFADEEGVRGKEGVVLLSHATWQDRFGGRSDVPGEVMTLNGEPYTVVGIVEESFEWLLAPNVDLWAPLVLEEGKAPRQRRDLFAIARLRDGLDEDAAQAEADALMSQLAKEYPEANKGYSTELLNLRYDIPDSRNRLFFRLIQVALIFVLLIACANIANLLLARSQAREREISIRRSMGADRRRIVAQMLTESLLMAVLAGAIGIALGVVGMKLLGGVFGNFLPSFWKPTLDPRVLAYSLAVTLFGGLLFGLAPVLQTAKFDLMSSLKEGSPGATSGGKRRLAASALVVAEIAFALAFLAGASIMIKTFQSMQSVDPGFATEKVLNMRVALPESTYDTPEKQVAGMREAALRLASLPGVSGTAVSDLGPRFPVLPQESFEIAGQPATDDQALPQTSLLTVAPGFFDGLGIPLLQGRDFSFADNLESPPVVVINQAMASKAWGGKNPIGERLTFMGESREVVGVVRTVVHDVILRAEGSALVYLPWTQSPDGNFGLALNAEIDPGSLSEPVRQALAAFDPNLVLTQVQTLDAFVEQFWVGQKAFSALLAGFGALALVLAAIGTYGVLAYSVAQRRHEIGIRMAIGAGRSRLVRMITRQGLILGGIGALLGIPLVVLEAKIIAAIFAGLAPVDPTAFGGVILLLGVVTFLASFLPARHAATIDPIQALRGE